VEAALERAAAGLKSVQKGWLAVLLSAQCTDARVNTVTPALFALADNPAAMAKVPVESIREIIKPCGLSPRKSAAISELSKILVAQHGGEVPADFESLEALPGVGHKTASVVMSQAFGVPAFPVDTHIHRLAQRWKLTSGKNVEQTERDLKRAFPEEKWNKLHLQIIFYGREHCSARGCDGTVCGICRTLFPERAKAVKTRK
jgi:endonuclease-3